MWENKLCEERAFRILLLGQAVGVIVVMVMFMIVVVVVVMVMMMMMMIVAVAMVVVVVIVVPMVVSVLYRRRIWRANSIRSWGEDALSASRRFSFPPCHLV